VARLAREARTVALLEHPNIVSLHAIKRLNNGLALVMQIVPGRTLKAALARGPLSIERTEQILRDISRALAYAHRCGVVHRDVKPENIFLDDVTGRALLSDFGVARSITENSELTATGTAIGTPTYMSPEQATGQEVDGRSDQYALGVLFYEMLAGKPPFVGETAMQIAFAHVHQPPPSLPGGYDFIEPLVMKMLAKDPKQRFPDLKAFVAELKGALTGSPVLQKRLKIDPTADISEQLQAIGFSESQLSARIPRMLNIDTPQGALKHTLLEGSALELEPVEQVRREVVRQEKTGVQVPVMLVMVVVFVVAAVAIVGLLF
jgi:serine/threonine protein kinase